jgi:hypothetical protein
LVAQLDVTVERPVLDQLEHEEPQRPVPRTVANQARPHRHAIANGVISSLTST